MAIFEKVAWNVLRTVPIPAHPAMKTSALFFEKLGIKLVGSDFKSEFCDLEVVAIDRVELVVRELEEATSDHLVENELGDKAETNFSQFCHFLALNGEKREWYIFFLRGQNGLLRDVLVSWSTGHRVWRIIDGPDGDRAKWFAGFLVVSPK